MKPLKVYEREIAKRLASAKPREDNSEVADLIIQARLEHFNRPNGDPDYMGKSYRYRTWFGDILDSLNLSHDDRQKLASRMRYSTGNALRRILTAEQLKEAGLSTTSPRDRSEQTYQKISAPYRLRNTKPEPSVKDSKEELERWFEDIRNTLHLLPEDETKQFLQEVLTDLDSDKRKYGTD